MDEMHMLLRIKVRRATTPEFRRAIWLASQHAPPPPKTSNVDFDFGRFVGGALVGGLMEMTRRIRTRTDIAPSPTVH